MLADIISRLSVDNRVEPEDTLDWSIQVFSIFQTQCSGEHKLKLLQRKALEATKSEVDRFNNKLISVESVQRQGFDVLSGINTFLIYV